MTPAETTKLPAKSSLTKLFVILGVVALGLITDASLLVAAVVIH